MSDHSDIPGVTFRNRGEGTLGSLFRATDWNATSLGPVDGWPQTLRGYVSMVLALPSPAIIFWGPDQTQLYNDGYAVIMGPRHPRYLGGSYRDCWPDTYPTIYPWMQRVLRGELVEVDRTLIPVTRHGFNEEAFFTFTFSPLRDDAGQIAGILQLVTEMTPTVLAERRERTLRALSPFPSLGRAGGSARIFSAVAGNPSCVPLSVLWHEDGIMKKRALHREGATGVELGTLPREALVQLDGLAERVYRENAPLELDDLQERFPGLTAPPWPEPLSTAVLHPIRRDASEPARGVFLAASPRLRLDAAYREFFARVAVEIAGAMAADQELFLIDQLSLALESAKMGTWRIDLITRRILVLDRTAALLGMEGPHEQDLDEINRERVHPEDLGFVNEALDQAIANNRLYTAEYRIRTVQGETRWLRSWGKPTYSSAGHPIAVTGVTLDVTEQVEARHRIEKLVTELAASVRARDEFISIASHELKTPLSSLKLQTQGMQRAIERDDPTAFAPERVKKLVAQSDRQTARLNRLVDDMLDVSRINTGKLSMVAAPLDLVELIRDTVERLGSSFSAVSVPLTVRAPATLTLTADRDRLEQVLVNLLTNALRYGKGSPVILTVEDRGLLARLVVEDQGPGIAATDHARIFDRFERAISASEVSGLGLGLFITRQIVEAHHGRIWVESAPGEGAAFVVELPRSPG